MKVIVSLEGTNLPQALHSVDALHHFCDAICIGPALLYCHGISALKPFITHFSDKELIVDAKLFTNGPDIVHMLAQEGAQWITVLAGADRAQLYSIAAQAAHERIKLLIDLSDATSPGQIAMEAPGLNAAAVLWHAHAHCLNNPNEIDSPWDFVHANSQTPIFVHSHVEQKRLHEVITLGPNGIIIDALTLGQANDPYYAQHLYQACKQPQQHI